MGVFDNFKQYNNAKQNLDKDGIDTVECEHRRCIFNSYGICFFETCMFKHPYMPSVHKDLTKKCVLCDKEVKVTETVKDVTYITIDAYNKFCDSCLEKIKDSL